MLSPAALIHLFRLRGRSTESQISLTLATSFSHPSNHQVVPKLAKRQCVLGSLWGILPVGHAIKKKKKSLKAFRRHPNQKREQPQLAPLAILQQINVKRQLSHYLVK